MVTMVDLGAASCIPCKMMAPILQKLEKLYAGKAAIVFLDVWVDPKPAQSFGIRIIPTQIFFNKKGEEVYRHEGFMSEEAIVTVLQKLGVN
jgi:thioredoxin 1